MLLLLGALGVAHLARPPKGRRAEPQPLSADDINRLALWWFAPFFSGGGYCSEAISFVTGLHGRLPLKISHHGDSFSWSFYDGLPHETQDMLEDLSYEPAQPRQAIVLCHSEPGAWVPALFETSECPVEGAAYRIGRTMFETDRIAEGWVTRCNEMDEIWVPTEFHYETFRRSGVAAEKLVVMPEPVDTAFWSRKTGKRKKKLPKRRLDRREVCDEAGVCEARRTTGGAPCFAFLSVFKWEARKGWDVLLQAFIEEFDARADLVCLYIKTSHFHSDEEFRDAIWDFAKGQLGITLEDWRTRVPTIEVLSDAIPHVEMPRLYRAVDAVVIPSRGEGWGRPHVEAMAMGLPLIATNWSGPTAYMTPTNSFPLRYDGLDTITEGPWRGHQWARPSVTHLKELMRTVYSDPLAAKAVGKRGQQFIKAHYDTPRVTSLVEQRLEEIRAKLRRKHKVKDEASATVTLQQKHKDMELADGEL